MAAYKYPSIPLADCGFEFTGTAHSDTYPFIDPATKSDLTGRTVFLTGGTKGIGRSTAISLAKAGASQIAIAARSDAGSLPDEMVAAAKAAGRSIPKILSIKIDVQEESSAVQAAKDVEKEFGKIDILINNAGYLETFKPVADSDPAEWWRTYEVNVRGVYLVTQTFLPLLLSKADGLKTVINVTSVGAHMILHGASSYQSGKLALLRFTEFICSEYANQGLLAYSVHPGSILTDMGKRLPEAYHESLQDKPEVAADVMVWLSQKRRIWLAGRYISATWDMEEFIGKEKEIVDGDLLKVRLRL